MQYAHLLFIGQQIFTTRLLGFLKHKLNEFEVFVI